MIGSEGNTSLKNPVTPPGIDPGTVRLVAQRLNHYTTPGPNKEMYGAKWTIIPQLLQNILCCLFSVTSVPQTKHTHLLLYRGAELSFVRFSLQKENYEGMQ